MIFQAERALDLLHRCRNMSHLTDHLHKRQNGSICRGQRGIDATGEFVQSFERFGLPFGAPSVHFENSGKAFIEIGEDICVAVILHFFLCGDGRCVDVGDVGRIVKVDGILKLHDWVCLEVEASDDA